MGKTTCSDCAGTGIREYVVPAPLQTRSDFNYLRFNGPRLTTVRDRCGCAAGKAVGS